ncbi:hypothetical protein Tco_1138566 [Tanacetum coccineum]
MNVKVRGEPIPTLPFVTSSVSATLGREGGDHTDFVSEPNFCTVGASQSGTVTIVTPMIDTAAVAKEKPAEPSLFGAASSSTGKTNPTPGGFSDLTSSDYIIGGIRTVIRFDIDL